MLLSELRNLKKIKENLLKSVILIVVSLSNCKSGQTTYDTIQNSEGLKSLKHQMFSSSNEFTNLPRLSISSAPIFNLEQPQTKITHTSIIRESKNSPSGERLIKKHMSNNTNTSQTPNMRVSHSLVDLVNSDIEQNINLNTSSDAPIFNSPMYFGTTNSTIIATQIGATAHIPCIVHHIGECLVSWIRKKDYHLLTVGLTTYSSDERFSATHLKHSEDWTLQIKFVQQRDAGIYECQVSTHPPTSIFLHLLVVEARAEISGPPIRYLTPGSTLRLQCHVVQNTESSEYIFWYHDNRMINYDADRGINVSTEPDFQSSELVISKTRREHSGNYTCVASNTQPASVLIHIFKGDNPAAMYHGRVGSSTKSYQAHLLHILLILIAMIYRTYVKRKIL